MNTPVRNNYTLGRGEVKFSPFLDANVQSFAGFKYLGNTPEFSMNVATTDLDHYSSDHGIKSKDQSITLEVNRSATITTDNVSLDNLALFFFGTKTVAQLAAGNINETHANVTPDTSLILGVTAASPAGAQNIGAITQVSNDAAQPTIYQIGRDYTIDLTTGELYIVAIENGGTITAGTNLVITGTTTAATQIGVLSSNNSIEGALKFTAKNPQGAQVDYLMPYVRLSPDGDFALKGDTWQQLKFKVAILDPKDGVRSAVYLGGRPFTGH